MSHHKIPQSAVDLIKRFEGFSDKAYICPAGVLTIGYGHTGPDVTPGEVITEERASDLLELDLMTFAKQIWDMVKVPLNENQFAALLSFTYNLGAQALKRSTLLFKLNKGQYGDVPSELMKWTHGGGKQLPGLVRRRVAEAALWDKEIPRDGHAA